MKERTITQPTEEQNTTTAPETATAATEPTENAVDEQPTEEPTTAAYTITRNAEEITADTTNTIPAHTVKYLKLERRGCEYFAPDKGRDDIGNYRVGSYDYSILGKDGRKYCIEFGVWDAWRIRRTNKRTGAALKHPITEIIKPHALRIDTSFNKLESDGFVSTWRNSALEKEQNDKHYDYSVAGILAAVNEISVDHYDAVQWID